VNVAFSCPYTVYSLNFPVKTPAVHGYYRYVIKATLN